MDSLKKIAGYIRLNLTTFISFELVFKILSIAVFPPLFRMLFTLVLRFSGLRYLTAENVGRFLRTLQIYPLLILLGTLYIFLEFFEFAGIIYLIDLSRKGHRTTFLQTFRYVFLRLKHLRRRDGIAMYFIVVLLTPVYHLPTALNMLWTYSVFQRIWKLVLHRWYFFFIIPAAVILLLVLFLRWRYVCHYFVLEDCSAGEARRRSVRLSHTEKPWNILPVIGVTVLLSAVYLALILIVLLASAVVQHLFSLSGAGVSSFQVSFLAVAVSLFDGLNVPVLFGMISILFYRCKKKRKEKVLEAGHMNEVLHPVHLSRRTEYLILAVCIVLAMVMIVRDSRSRYKLRIQGLREMQVTAHRGASMFFPENTMAAFTGAVEQGCDWIELDVHESKDGQVFVMHDPNFQRTTGVTANTWEMTWEEISALDAGSFFSKDYSEERIPLLSDVLEFARETGVCLNIEIKPTGHERNLVSSVVRMVEEADLVSECVITSQAYHVIEEVKELNEEIETVYVMGLAFGAINRLTAADAFSIRATSISRSLVRNLHNRGIEIYAWTVDSRGNINRMIDVGVDNIITNNVPLAVECINTSRTGNRIVELLQLIRDLFP